MKNRTLIARHGRTLKSGLSLRTRPDRPTGGIGPYRGVVLNTYATDDDRRIDEHPFSIFCDVLLMRSQYPLQHVPVMQASGHGLHDGSIWIPRPSTRSLGGGPLHFDMRSLRGALQELPTSLDDLDGDHVLVNFIEGDQEYPIITGALPHSRTKRLVVKGSGWDPSLRGADRGKPQLGEHYVRFRGVELRINDHGDVLLDTSGAYGRTGDIAEAPAPTGGQVRLRLKGTEKMTIEVNGTDALEFSVTGILALLKIAGAVQADTEVSAMNLLPGLSVSLSTHMTPSPFGPLGPPLPGT